MTPRLPGSAFAGRSAEEVYRDMPSSPCLESPCPNPATYRGRCSEHARKRDKQINRPGRPVYGTNRWKRLRRHKLRLNPLCEYVDPDEGPCQAIATDVHHRQAIAEGGEKWAMANLEALCHSHHSMHTRQEQLTKGATV